MSLSPRGASVVQVGQPLKAWFIMLIGGVLGWISGQSWSVERGSGELFQLIMAFGTLVVIAVPAALIAGLTGRPLALAVAGGLGMAVPWFFSLAVASQGQDMLGTSLGILVASLLVTYVVTAVTKRLMLRWDA